MGLVKMFKDLIDEGGYTKTYLLAKALRFKNMGVINDTEYNEIVSLINASNLQP